MYVGVIHTIKNPNGWTSMLKDFDPAAMPEGIELEATGTAADAARAICLWRAPSLEVLQRTLDEMLSQVASVNDCFPVPDEYSTKSVLAGKRAHAASV